MKTIVQRREVFAKRMVIAARLVENGKERFSCNAVRASFGKVARYCDKSSDAVQAYGKMVCPRPVGSVRITDYEGYGETHRKGALDHRVTALCFVAAWVLDGVFDDLLPL